VKLLATLDCLKSTYDDGVVSVGSRGLINEGFFSSFHLTGVLPPNLKVFSCYGLAFDWCQLPNQNSPHER